MALRGRNLWGRGGNTQGQRNATRRGGTGRRDWEGPRAGGEVSSRNEKVRQTEWKRSDAGGGWKKPRRRGGGGGGGGGENKQKDPRNRARRRTGANKIPVNWEPPSQVPQGVTAKSAPPRKPSPSPMGPVGRGRPTPAWQKAEGAAPASAGHGRVPRPNFGSMPSIPGRHNASFPSRPPPSNRPRRSAGREMHRRGVARRAVSRSRRRRPMRPLRKEAESKRSDDRSRRYERDRPMGRRDGPGRKDGRKEQPRRRSRHQARRPPMQPPMRDELIECSRHRKKRSWDKIDVDAENKFVCVAGCPCIVHLGGSRGWEELREALKSRGETDLLDDLDAEASATESKESSVAGAPPETSTAMVPVPEELAMPQSTTESLSLQKVEPPPPPPNMVAKSSAILEGDIDPNDL